VVSALNLFRGGAVGLIDWLGLWRLVAFILRQRVTNFEPWCLVAHKDVSRGADGWLIHEGAQSHVHTITNHRIKQRAANLAVNVVVRSHPDFHTGISALVHLRSEACFFQYLQMA
jgi:hypothetical protein